jgi:glycosyltransferase involved in cell wall biosynthesis
MKTSIITVCLNSAATVEDTIRSVLSQDYRDIEHIVVDGGSTDGALDIINRCANNTVKVISEPDDGIYDAMNKGIKLSSGDVIAALNSDDVYINDTVVTEMLDFIAAANLDAAYADLVYVDRENLDKVVRYWKAGPYKKGAFHYGWVPPHPAFFCKRELFERYGSFKADYKIAADFELMLRFIEKHQVKVGYLARPIVKMRTGGKANILQGIIRGNREIIRSFRLNNLRLSPWFFVLKPIKKISQLFTRPGKLNNRNTDL